MAAVQSMYSLQISGKSFKKRQAILLNQKGNQKFCEKNVLRLKRCLLWFLCGGSYQSNIQYMKMSLGGVKLHHSENTGYKQQPEHVEKNKEFSTEQN